nr:nuclear apoptosis-inducing factor 1-like [Oncorhynchus nerka]XP_029544825.1 nuclear apoptosis-inducing factor 1-like [Oncorhynchus nerka]
MRGDEIPRCRDHVPHSGGRRHGGVLHHHRGHTHRGDRHGVASSENAGGSVFDPTAQQAKPQELKSRIALNSARLFQEQRVTNVHVRQIAQHLEGQNQLLQMIRRSQEAQPYAQERQAQALECTQAALLALVQMMRPALKDLRKFLQSGTDNSNNSGTLAEGSQ